ncbi:MAG: hypothetical protein ABIJ23_02810, partial [Candidatus Magasanikbacteria bacterium]
MGFRQVLQRAKVLDIDFEGGKFYSDSPRNAVKASVYNSSNSFSDVMFPDGSVFYPAIDPFIQLPLKIGETVYVLYESNNENNIYSGVWLWRCSEPLSNQLVNYINTSDKFNDGLSNSEKAENSESDNEEDIDSMEYVSYQTGSPQKNIKSAYSTINDIDPLTGAEQSLSVYESVPRFIKRGDDLVLMGSNNNMIVFQVDRPGDIYSGLKKSAGTIDVVCGRRGWRESYDGKQVTTSGLPATEGISKAGFMNLIEGSTDFIRDRARHYTSMRSDADNSFSTTRHLMVSIEEENVIIQDKNGKALFSVPIGVRDPDADWSENFDENIDRRTADSSFDLAKADCIRSIARHSVKIESLNQAKVVNEDGNTTNNFTQTINENGQVNIGSSVILNPDGVILIETQNKKGMIRIDPNSPDKFIDISIKDLPQHDPAAQELSSIVMKPDGEMIIN